LGGIEPVPVGHIAADIAAAAAVVSHRVVEEAAESKYL
jgi:hypothetical protein